MIWRAALLDSGDLVELSKTTQSCWMKRDSRRPGLWRVAIWMSIASAR